MKSKLFNDHVKCKNCKFWKGTEIGTCNSPKIAKDDNGPSFDGIQPGAGLNTVSLWTGPNFGCINFEEKQ